MVDYSVSVKQIRWMWFPVLVLVSVLLALVFVLRVSDYAVCTGIIEPGIIVPLIAPQTGIIKYSGILEGSRVEQGDLLLKINSEYDESNLRLLEHEKMSSERLLDMLSRMKTLQKEQGITIDSHAVYRKTKNEQLRENRSLSHFDYSQSMFAIEQELLDIEKAKLDLDMEIEDLRDTIESTRILIERQINSINEFSYRAPAEGTIVLVDTVFRAPNSVNFFGLYPVEGLYVTRGNLIGYLVRHDVLEAKVTIPEKKILEIKVGSPVSLMFSALPDSYKKGLTGKLVSVSPSAQNGEFIGRIVIQTSSLQEDESFSAETLIGTTVEARIALERKTASQKIADLVGI